MSQGSVSRTPREALPPCLCPDTEQPALNLALIGYMFLWLFHCHSLNIEQVLYCRPSLKLICPPICSPDFANDNAAITIPRQHLGWPSGRAHVRTNSILHSLRG